MTVTTIAKTVSRRLIETSLDASRLPLTLAARAAGQSDNPEWPPTMAADLVESYVESWAGRMTKDAALAGRGEARRARAEQYRRAASLDAAADAVQQSADTQLADDRAELAEQRAAVAASSQQDKAQIESRAQVRKGKSKKSAAKKVTVVRQAEARQADQIEKVRRAGTKAALNAEARALKITREALDADEAVDVIDAAIADDTMSSPAAARP